LEQDGAFSRATGLKRRRFALVWDDFLVGGIVFASFKEKKICFSVGRTHHVADRRLEVMRGIL